MTDELVYATVTELRSLLDAGRVSAREVMDAVLDRIDEHNGTLNAVVTVDADGARTQADAADAARVAGEPTGLLHGIPVTIKDCFDVARMLTTCGDPRYAHYVPTSDAEAVARLRRAGAIVVGRTNVPFRLGDLQTSNPVFGRTANPWDTALTPGGSGGGTGAALASGMTPFDIGGDFGGSIRIPASHCGVYGLKASFGLIPCTGMLPLPPGHAAELDMETPGPLARSIDDLELGLDVMAGPRPLEAPGWSLRLPEPRSTGVDGLRFGVWLDDPSYPTAREVLSVLTAAVDALSDAGAQLVEIAQPGLLGEVMDVFVPLSLGNVGALSPDDEYEVQLVDADISPRFRTMHLLAERRAQLRWRWNALFEKVDVILAPSCVVAAHPDDPEPDLRRRTIRVDGVERPYLDLQAWAAPANALYLPGLAAPVGLTTSGLPVGIQLIANYLHDRTALAAGRVVAEVVAAFRRPPGY